MPGITWAPKRPPIENSLYEFPYYGSSLKESSITRKDKEMRPTMVKMDGYMYLSIPQRGNLLDARIRWGKNVGMAVSIPAEHNGRTIVRGDIRI